MAARSEVFPQLLLQEDTGVTIITIDGAVQESASANSTLLLLGVGS